MQYMVCLLARGRHYCLGKLIRRSFNILSSVEPFYKQVAKLAYESVMVVSPRRPNQMEFLDLERKVKEQALLLYNFTWKPGSQVI